MNFQLIFSVKEIDHFADVPERFKYIFMNCNGLKMVSTVRPNLIKDYFFPEYPGSEVITIGNIGEICNDWQESLIERPSAKESSVEPTDLELMTIERDSYKLENNALKSEITILEGKLKQAGVDNMTDHKRVSSPIPDKKGYSVSGTTIVFDKPIDKNISLALSHTDFVDYKCGVIYNAAYFGDNLT